MDDNSTFTSSRSDSGNEAHDIDDDGANEIGPRIKLRNYAPQTKFLDGIFAMERAQAGTLSSHIEDKLAMLKEDSDSGKAKTNKYKLDEGALDPKKPDWDLKRRLERKMEKLDRETRKSIDKYIKSGRDKSRQ